MNATQYITLKQKFHMTHGVLSELSIAYETWGKLSETKNNVIFLFTGLSPSAHAASSKENPEKGWWEYLIGNNLPLDTSKYYIICINSLGSCFGSTGPTSINPETNQPYKMSFPLLTIEDIAKSAFELLNALDIQKIHLLIGASMGGMSALAFSALFPQMTTYMLNISSCIHASPYAVAFRSLQREIVQRDPNWKNGNYDITSPPTEGLYIARKLGMISYRSPEEWLERFDRSKEEIATITSPLEPSFSIESYLDHTAKKLSHHFDPNAYLYLSKAMDLFNLKNHDLTKCYANTTLKKLSIIGVSSDTLFPSWQQEALHTLYSELKISSSITILNSNKGHDAFLSEKELFSTTILSFMETLQHNT